MEDIEARQLKEQRAFERLMANDNDEWAQKQLQAQDNGHNDEFDLDFGTGEDMAAAMDQDET